MENKAKGAEKTSKEERANGKEKTKVHERAIGQEKPNKGEREFNPLPALVDATLAIEKLRVASEVRQSHFALVELLTLLRDTQHTLGLAESKESVRRILAK